MRRIALLALLAACGGGGGGSNTPTSPNPTPPTPGPAAVASVTVTGVSSISAIGSTVQLTATTKDASGNTLTGRVVTWNSSANTVMTVSNTGLVTAVANGNATITANSEGREGALNITVATQNIFSVIGTILTAVDFAVTSGPVADATAVQLPDGRVRIYLFAQGQGMRSAISTNNAGTAFTAEPGVRSLTSTWGQPRAIKLSDGRVRVYYVSGDGIRSAVTTDGLTFVDEAGTRLSNSTVGYQIGAFTIVPTSTGYRAYFSNLEMPGGMINGHRIRSATSPDLLTWTLEPGVVLGVGATTGVSLSSSHPFAVANANGSVTLYYSGERANPSGPGYVGLLRSTSIDGRTFMTEERLGIDRAADPDLITLANGTTMLYFGGGDPAFSAPVVKAAKLNQ